MRLMVELNPSFLVVGVECLCVFFISVFGEIYVESEGFGFWRLLGFLGVWGLFLFVLFLGLHAFFITVLVVGSGFFFFCHLGIGFMSFGIFYLLVFSFSL